jgi:elongation factor P
MKIQGVEIRVGNILQWEGRLWTVTKTQHTQPGKGGAYMQVEMKDVSSGTKTNNRFRSDETVERAVLDEREYQYLYSEGDMLTFMDNQNYEQVMLEADLVGDSLPFLKENMNVRISMFEEKPIGITLPLTVVLEIVEADPVVKGQTASSSYKPAVLENGVKILVPPFIAAGEKVVVNTSDGSYIERSKAA